MFWSSERNDDMKYVKVETSKIALHVKNKRIDENKKKQCDPAYCGTSQFTEKLREVTILGM